MKDLRNMIFCILVLAAVTPARAQKSLVNFAHLDHLTERIYFLGDTVSIVHVYANYPSYEWTDAKESGPEGVACVDDAARAAVLYLRHYELNHDEGSLHRAVSLLKFITKMQADDGQFYNFMLADHTINKEGKTSFKSFGWWAARGVWAMATGSRILRDVDPPFAGDLRERVERTFPYIDSLLRRYGKYETMERYRIPKWLLYESGADVTSELLLGLTQYYELTHAQKVKVYIRNLTDALLIMQNGDVRTYPYGLHRSWRTMWHMWGNGQTQALATAGGSLKNSGMLQSAEKEAKGFYSRLLIDGYMKEMDIADSNKTSRYEQIAYAVRPMAVGLLRLYEVTKNEKYLKMAGLAASWFFGNNALHQQMYDTATGRCFDGIRDSASVNKNSGAESTIEALMTMVELDRYPTVRKFFDCHKLKTGDTSRYHYAVFRNDKADEEFTLAIDRKKQDVLFLEGKDNLKFQLSVTTP